MKADIIRFWKYLGVAIGSAAVDWAVFTLLIFLDVSHIGAIMTSRVLGGFWSFAMNRRWTFLASERAITIQGRRFLLLYGVSYCLAVSLLFLFKDIFSIQVFIAKLLADTICLVFNFLLMRFYVYSGVIGISARLSSLLRLG